MALNILIVTCSSGAKDGGPTSTTPPAGNAATARVSISPATATVQPWQTVTLSATVYDSAGNVLANRPIAWTNSDSLHASVNGQGAVTGNLLGSVTVTASSGGYSATAIVTIALTSSVSVGPNVDMDPTLSASESSVAINPSNPLNIVASTNWAHFYSFDGGRSWKRSDVAANGTANMDPNVAFTRTGTLLRQGLGSELSGPPSVVIQRSLDGGRTLGQGVFAFQARQGATSGDQGILTIDGVSTSPYFGSAYVVVSEYQATGFVTAFPSIGFPLIVLSSRDGGITWNAPVDISDSPVNSQEHSSSITTGPNGEVYAAWMNTAVGQVMFGRSLDGGRTWDKNTIVRVNPYRAPFLLVDDMRGNPTIDVDRSSGPNRGAIYISSIDKNGPSAGAVDAWIARSADGGATWSSPVLLSDGPHGPYSFEFQPRISVAPNGRVDAAWYEIRSWTGSSVPTYDVYYSYSTNGGVSFSPSVRVTSASSIKAVTVFGEYMGLTSDNTRAVAVWTDQRTGSPHAYFSVIWHASGSQ